jgi:hypothetical protein
MNPFYHPKRRLERAQRHLASLKNEIGRFKRDDPYVAVIEPDPDGVHKTWKIKFKPVPSVCDDLAFETLFTLRAALDQAAYAASKALEIVPPKSASFPIAKDASHFEKAIKGKCDHLPKEIQALFRQFQPYRGGDGHAIWILNELRNRVHTVLVPVDITRRKLGIFWSEGGVRLESHWGGPDELVVKGRTFGGKSDFHLKNTEGSSVGKRPSLACWPTRQPREKL